MRKATKSIGTAVAACAAVMGVALAFAADDGTSMVQSDAAWGPDQQVAAAPQDIMMSKASPSVQGDVEAMIHKFGAMMSDLKGPRPSQLFDKTVSPMYLAEENIDWTDGVDQLLWYHDTPERLAFVDALDYQSSNIRVRMLAPDVALAAWHVHANQKMRRGRPWAEYFRANAVLRKTPNDGWKFVYYAEAPRSTMAYVRELYERMVSPEFKEKHPGPEETVGR